MTAGVYTIRNKIDGKVYVGSGIKVAARLIRQRSDLNRGKHPNEYLQRAYIKHGADNFSFEVLVLCEAGERLAIEQSYIDHFKSTKEEFGYNLIPTRESQLYGEAISTHQKAGWAKLTPEERSNNRPHLHSEENDSRLAKARASIKFDAAFRDSHRKMAFETIASPEMRKHHSERLKKLWQDPEFRAKRLEGLTRGRNKSNARRAALAKDVT